MNDQELAKMKDLAKELYGKTVALSPRNSFFSDADQQYALCIQGPKGSSSPADRVVIKEGWKLYSTMIAIRNGLLKVFDGNKDITSTFGGTSNIDESVKPIVQDVPLQVNMEDSRDKMFFQLLSQPVESEVMKAISSRALPYADLERLLELEKKGDNPTSAPRRSIVDGICELMKNTSGLGRVGKIDDETEAVVTTKRA